MSRIKKIEDSYSYENLWLLFSIVYNEYSYYLHRNVDDNLKWVFLSKKKIVQNFQSMVTPFLPCWFAPPISHLLFLSKLEARSEPVEKKGKNTYYTYVDTKLSDI